MAPLSISVHIEEIYTISLKFGLNRPFYIKFHKNGPTGLVDTSDVWYRSPGYLRAVFVPLQSLIYFCRKKIRNKIPFLSRHFRRKYSEILSRLVLETVHTMDFTCVCPQGCSYNYLNRYTFLNSSE